jgi:hypothetical protein
MTRPIAPAAEHHVANLDLYQRLAVHSTSPMRLIAGRGTETRETPETSDSDIFHVISHAAGLPAR